MSTQITTQKILAFDEYADFANLPGVEGFIYIDNSANIGYIWDSVALTYVNIGGEPEPPIPPDPIPLLFVSAATSGAITPVPNYTNGVAGVGATLIGGVDGALTDGTAPGKIDLTYTPIAGDIILVKDQTVSTNLSLNKAFQNGVYLVVDPGSSTSKYELLRLPDYDTTTGLYPLQVNATGGTNNVTRYYIQTTVNPVIGTNNATGNLIFPITTGQSVSAPIAFVDTVIDTTLPDSVYANGTTFLTLPGNNATLTATAFGPLGTHNGLTATLDNNSVTGFRRALVINQPGANAAYNGDYVVVRPGSIYTSAAGATSAGTIITVTSTAGLQAGMSVTLFSGSGAFAANTTVSSITNATKFIITIPVTTPLSGGAVVRAGTTWQLRRIQTGAGGFDRYTRYFMVSNTGSTKAGKYYFTTPNAAPLTNNSSLAPFNTGIGIAPINIVEYGGASTGPFGIANSSGVYTYYATMTLVMTAAGAGANKTIEMFADVTETNIATITFPTGVTLNGNGHTYTFDAIGAVNAFEMPINSVCYIFDAILKIKTSTGALINMLTNATLRGNAILSGTSTAANYSEYIVKSNSTNTPISISGFTIIAEGTKCGLQLGNSTTTVYSYADSLEIYSDTGRALFVYDSAQARNCNIYAKNPATIMSPVPGAAVQIQGSLVNSLVQSGSSNIVGANTALAVYLFVGNFPDPPTQPRGLYNCEIISLTGDGVTLENGTDIENCRITVYGAGKKAMTSTVSPAQDKYIDVHRCILRSIDGPCIEQNLKWLSFTDCYLFAGNGSGITNINNNPTYDTIRLRRCFIEVATSDATYHGVVLSSNTTIPNEVTNCYFSVVNASSYAISALGATTAKCAQNAFKGSTTPINPLVTNTSNIIDPQGNVTI